MGLDDLSANFLNVVHKDREKKIGSNRSIYEIHHSAQNGFGDISSNGTDSKEDHSQCVGEHDLFACQSKQFKG
jgi:hypothetical protein